MRGLRVMGRTLSPSLSAASPASAGKASSTLAVPSPSASKRRRPSLGQTSELSPARRDKTGVIQSELRASIRRAPQKANFHDISKAGRMIVRTECYRALCMRTIFSISTHRHHRRPCQNFQPRPWATGRGCPQSGHHPSHGLPMGPQGGHRQRYPRLLDATKHAPIEVSCGRQFGEFGALPPLDVVRRRLASSTYPKLSSKLQQMSAAERFE